MASSNVELLNSDPMLDAAQLAAAGLTPDEIAALQAKRAPDLTAREKKAINAYPRYVFGPDVWRREPGTMVKVRNAFEEAGGTIVRKLTDVAFVARIDDEREIIVHESSEAWA
jgi:hypothetical protein